MPRRNIPGKYAAGWSIRKHQKGARQNMDIPSYKRIYELIEIYENRGAIIDHLKQRGYPIHRISWSRASRALRELKKRKKKEGVIV